MLHTRNKGDQCSAVRRMFNGLVLFGLSFFMLVAAMPASAGAEETARKDGWQFNADLYLWGASVGGETPGGSDIDVSFSDLLKDLEFGFMGGVGARKGNWSFMTDLMYMKLKQDNNGQVTVPVGPGVNIDVDATVKLQAWVVTPAVGYNLADTDKFKFEVLAGARYLWVKPELDLKTTGPLKPRDKSISDSGSVWDGIVGIRGNVNLDKKWFVPYYADIGAGNTPFTCQAMAGVGYRISDAVDVGALYRYLYWKFNDNKVLDKLSFSGPLVGMRYRF